eukprot:571323-Amphidinium_carterae.1
MFSKTTKRSRLLLVRLEPRDTRVVRARLQVLALPTGTGLKNILHILRNVDLCGLNEYLTLAAKSLTKKQPTPPVGDSPKPQEKDTQKTESKLLSRQEKETTLNESLHDACCSKVPMPLKTSFEKVAPKCKQNLPKSANVFGED